MSSKRIRILSATVAAIIVMSSVLAGCGKKENSQENNTAKTSEQSGKDEGMAGNVYKTGLPIVKDKVTLKTIVSINSNLKQPAKDLLMWKELEKETNVGLEMEEIPEANYAEKFNLLVASGSLPDFFLRTNADVNDKYYNTGLFLPLNDLIKTWAPAIQKAVSDPVQAVNMQSPDGKLYTFPVGELAPWSLLTDQLFINKVWLQALGLKMPETTDDLYNVLKAFKEKDPNKNGKQDELPMSIEITNSKNNAYKLFGAFGLPISIDHEMIKDGKYVYGPTQNSYRDALMYFSKLYSEGLLDKESFTQQATGIKAKANGAEALVGSIIGVYPDSYMDANKIENYAVVPPLKGPKGDQIWEGAMLVLKKGGAAISKQCKYPEVIARWIDNMNSTPLKKAMVAYGPESLGVMTIKDNKYVMNTDKAPQGMTFEAWSRNITLRTMPPIFTLADEIEKYRVMDPVAERKLAYVNAYKPYLNKEAITAATFSLVSVEDRETLISIEADMKPVISNFIAKAIMEGITDVTWSKFQDDLKKAKLDKYIEIKTKALAEYNKAVKK